MITFSHTLKRYCFTLLFCIISIQVYAQNPVTKGQWYIIESYQKNHVLQVQAPYENNGIAITLAKRTNQNNQLFRFEEVGNGFYIIRSKQHNKVFDIRGGSREDYAILQVWDMANVENQKFKLNLATGNGHYYINAKHSNKSLVVDAGYPIGSTIKQKSVNGLSNAMFKFIPQKSIKPTPSPVNITKQPKLISPVTGQVIENKKGVIIKFSWEKVPNATQYQLYVEHKNKKDKLLNSLFNENYYNFTLTKAIDASLAKDAWGWWVRAKVGNTWGKWSKPNTLYFKDSKPTPAIVTLNSPQTNATLANGQENNSTKYSWNFDWTDTPNAQQYEILVSHPSNAGKSFRKTVSTSEYKLVQRNHRTSAELLGWSWKVRPIVNGVYGQWSTTRKFTVDQPGKQAKPTPSIDFVTQSKNSFSKVWKNKHFAKISNKISSKNTLGGYNMNSKKFAMNATNTDWHVRSIGNNRFLLQVFINGKFWSLAAANDNKGNVILANNNKNDTFQQWEITQQTDGYYKIINIGMKQEKYRIDDTLFYDSKNNDFFVSKWQEGKTANGLWYFDAKQQIKIKNDPLENRSFKISSVVNNKQICLGYVWTSDATGHNELGFCNNNDKSTLFSFQKTLRNTYLIKVRKLSSKDEWNYLKGDLGEQEIERHKDAPIIKEYGFEWNIINRGNGQYMIFNVDSGKAIELIQRSNGFPREFIEFKTATNKRTQYFRLN